MILFTPYSPLQASSREILHVEIDFINAAIADIKPEIATMVSASNMV